MNPIGEPRVPAVLPDRRVQGRQQVRQHADRIAPHVHGRGTRMRLLALDDDFVPAHMLHPGHHADGLVFLFEHGTLLDVHLERGFDRLALQWRVRLGILAPR